MTTKIYDYDSHNIESETKQILYWMADTAKCLQEGKARFAITSLSNALQHIAELAITQNKLYIENGYQAPELDYKKIYEEALIKAKKEIKEYYNK